MQYLSPASDDKAGHAIANLVRYIFSRGHASIISHVQLKCIIAILAVDVVAFIFGIVFAVVSGLGFPFYGVYGIYYFPPISTHFLQELLA